MVDFLNVSTVQYMYMSSFCRSFMQMFYSSQSQALSFFTHFWFILQNHLKFGLLFLSMTLQFFKKNSIYVKNLYIKCNWQGYVISSTYIRRNLFIDTKSLNHCENLYMCVEIRWRVDQALYTKWAFKMILKDLIYHYEGYLKILTVAIDCTVNGYLS